MRIVGVVAAGLLGCGLAWGQAPVERVGGRIDLPSSKQIVGMVPGSPQRLSSLPVTMAASPDGKWVVVVTAGYGSAQSSYLQGLAVVSTATGAVREFPDVRTGPEAGQVLFSGLAFSADGTRVYASLASESDPAGEKVGDTGSGVAVYSFADGVLTPVKVLKVPAQRLAARKTTLLGDSPAKEKKHAREQGAEASVGVPYPAALAVVGEAREEGRGKREEKAGSMGGPTHRDVDAMKGARERLLVADNLSDDVLLMDAASGQVLTRFDLSEGAVIPGTYPIGVVASKDGTKAYVALWNASEVVELDLVHGQVGRKMALLKNANPVLPGSHPEALALAPDGKTLYVALGNRDAVAALDLSGGKFALKGFFDARLPGQSFYGAQPEALAVSADGKRLYCADMGADAVAVMETGQLTKGRVKRGFVEPVGFVPTEWLPMAVAVSGGKLYVASGKGTGTGPNNVAQPLTAEEARLYPRLKRKFSYIPTLLHGSVAVVSEGAVGSGLKEFTEETLVDNRMRAGEERIAWSAEALATARAREREEGRGIREEKTRGGPTHRDEAAVNGAREEGGAGRKTSAIANAGVLRSAQDDGVLGRGKGAQAMANTFSEPAFPGPIRHVIYIIRENRTYDQLLGDLTDYNGKPVGNGDASLAMYGERVTPNIHKLARQFGVLDNFYDSAEVSGDGHVWSNTAIGTDYLERTWQDDYRGRQRGYDYEGMVSLGLPLEQGIPDVNEPNSGYIWGNVAKHGMTVLHFGEYISSTFCNEKEGAGAELDPTNGPLGPGKACAAGNAVKPGEMLPVVWGGGVNKFGWAIPLLATNRATKPELVGHFVPEYPDFNLKVPDQVRVDIFERHLAGWVKDRAAGRDTMPNFVMLRVANDHTAGTAVGSPRPEASIADNDLAVGRAVEAISHSAYWDDTAFFILEDDAQNGADHVDAHRSVGFVVSKWAPKLADGGVFVDSRFYSTVSMVRTMEMALGLPPMNNNDALSSAMGSLLTGKGDQAPFVADYANEKNGLIYEANTKRAVGAKESAKMDFTHADRADSQKLNVILWQDAMGDAPVPATLLEKRKKAKKDDDDD